MLASLVLALACGFIQANAEQPAANEYREMFRAGNFYVEFKDKWDVRILAGYDNVRLERMSYRFEESGLAYLNPLGAIFAGAPKNPEVMYKDGKYYQFVEKNKAFVCAASDLDAENLDPRQGWGKISQKLALPDELAVFYWKDSFRVVSPAIAAPQFTESIKKECDGIEYDCDRYIGSIKTASGSTEAKIVYDMLYREGKLVMAESYVVRNGTEYPVNRLEIKRLQSEIPKGAFKIDKNTRLYAAGQGDMNDLLERPQEIGRLATEEMEDDK